MSKCKEPHCQPLPFPAVCIRAMPPWTPLEGLGPGSRCSNCGWRRWGQDGVSWETDCPCGPSCVALTQ